MKEVTESIAVELYVTDPDTGERLNVSGTKRVTSAYYSVREITSRINAMNLLTVLAKVCKSPRDLEAVNYLLDTGNSEGRVVVSNVTETAKTLGVARSKLNTILKGCVDERLFHKEGTGVYFVNPFIFIGKRVRSNEAREELQRQWSTLDRGKE